MKTKTSREAGTRTRRVSRAVIAGGSAMVLGGLSLATSSPAGASHDHDEPSGVLNSPAWRVCTDGPAAFGPAAVNWATALYNSHPDLTVTQLGHVSSPACQTQMNLFVRYDYFPLETWDGATVCFHSAGGSSCNIKAVVLNGSAIEAAPNPGAQWKYAACHEFGHVAGLGDRPVTSSCMMEGQSPPVALIPDSHDWDAISATY